MALVVDNYGSDRLGRRKSWIIPCTAIGALSYALLALFPPSLVSLHIIVGILIFKSFVMADIPGIIEGAAEGRGLGHYFLRHIERNSILLFMIPADTDNVKKVFDILITELRTYNPEMMDKDYIVALSKCDLLDDELKVEYAEEMEKNFGDIPHCMISALDQSGIIPLKDLIWKKLNAPND